LTEDTPCHPISGYGREKLRQEGALRAYLDATLHVGWLIGRFSTIYGTGQNLAKPQGFISQMVRTLLFHRPMHVYVPLDTQRDFLYAEDAARHLLRCVTELLSMPTPGRAIKIFATGRSVALSEIVALLRRVAKQPVRILSPPSPQRVFHPAKLVFRSVALDHVRLPPVTNLAAGVAAVYHHQLRLLQRGVLPPPPAAWGRELALGGEVTRGFEVRGSGVVRLRGASAHRRVRSRPPTRRPGATRSPRP
jgi:UDP-glucose 4-epimerase